MKFKFENKEQEDSFLKTRTESLLLPQDLKNRIFQKGIRTLRGLIAHSDKELNKITGSRGDTKILINALDKAAVRYILEQKLKPILNHESDSGQSENEDSVLPELPESDLVLQSFGGSDDIVETFATHFGTNAKDIVGGSRKAELVEVRHQIAYILREYADMSFPAIGRLLGGRDHTTIIYAYNKFKNNLKSDEGFRLRFKDLIKEAETIKERKTHIEKDLIPNLVASIRQKQLEAKMVLKPAQIPERNMKIVELFKEGLTLEQMGKIFNVTRERARQIAEKTIRQIAINEAIAKGIELNTDIVLSEEKKKRMAMRKGVPVEKIAKEKTWSRYFLACKSCGTTSVPHRVHGLCENCTRQYSKATRDRIIEQHSNTCDRCEITRSEAMQQYGRDFYITKTKEVLCRKCFLEVTGKRLGATTRGRARKTL